MIHPRRLKGTAANIARYYSVGDYYSKGADEHSEWGGAIASDLGLEGKVDPAMLKELLAGRVAGQQLGRHQANGEIEHHPGWDFAVNAPKSVSIMALVAGDERIIAAHERAVGTALGYLEEHATLRRRIDGEIVHETTGRLIFARFTEHASRELDPHLHTHAVVMNMTNHEPGEQMASLETRAMYAEQMTAGQVYRNELAYHLRSLGYSVGHDPRSGLFEIRAVPAELIAAFSHRAEEIDAHAIEHGLTGQAARRKSFYETRPPKAKLGLDALREQWTQRAGRHADGLERMVEEAELAASPDFQTERNAAGRATLFGVRQAETGEAINNLGKMIRLGLASHVGDVRLGDIRPMLSEHEERGKLLATRFESGDQVHTRGRTSRKTARLEQSLAMHLALALDDGRPLASADRLGPVLETAGLTPAQEKALVDAALSRDRVTAIHGVAGSGKSTLIRALNVAAGKGATLVAVAPTSSAAANLGYTARIESRTVASLIASGGHGVTASHVIVLDEAGQLGSRQALRLLQISRDTGARLLLLGDNKQTGAIEQGKPFWLLQRMGMPTAELTESVRQQTKAMQASVAAARSGDYAASLASLDKVASGEGADMLAKMLVSEWTRLKPETRTGTNILVLDNATRLVVNGQIREVLRREGVIAAEDTRLGVLTPTGMSAEEKHHARFYSRGQVVTFGRDLAGLGVARGAEYRVLGFGRNGSSRQIVQLVDEHGRIIGWDPRLGSARQVNVFNREERSLAAGDRIQWRLVSKDLALKNAERGTVESLSGAVATIRWDRGDRRQNIDLGEHKTWDHGYSETIFSSQSKTYDRAYVLAPVNSGLVNGQNYYTAITRARFGVKLWTEDEKRLAEKLSARSGEKTSALEGLGRLGRDRADALSDRHSAEIEARRAEQIQLREDRRIYDLDRSRGRPGQRGAASRVAANARDFAEVVGSFLDSAGPRKPRRRRARRETRHGACPRTARYPRSQPLAEIA
ncbi:relaxase domain-containing protein [Novosphingobium sp. G106]|uniref:MobF family relaxase n=1 Tax=Novosphingobium sp. G106 TaxID=2849500 RepID=UPI001C2CE7FC|nr:MobF family relaxase [Novosphingobium sp. G106]MBV1687697.1 relaxase domain-containing protein [Novosphingobium sp. G106]